MHKIVLALGAALAFGVFVQPAGAVLVTPAPTLDPPSNVVLVDRRCGPRARYVPRHRNKYGRMVRGRCVAYRRSRRR